MLNSARLGFAFFPRKTTVEQADKYIEAVYEAFPGCITMLSALQVNENAPGVEVKDKPFITFTTNSKTHQDLVSRAAPFLAAARFSYKLDYLFFNTAMLRYPVDVFIDFVKKSLVSLPVADIVMGEPPILSPEKVEEFVREHTADLDKQTVRQRLLSDAFNSFVTCNALGTKTINVNAGMFRIRTQQEVLKTLLCMHQFEDFSLVCPLYLLHMYFQFENGTLPVENIYLTELGFNMEKAAKETAHLFDLLARMGKHQMVSKMVSDFFVPGGPCSRWAGQKDSDWFEKVFVEEVRKHYLGP